MMLKNYSPLRRYVYDALDRLVVQTQCNSVNTTKRFYCGDLLATEIQEVKNYAFFRYSEILLAQQKKSKDALAVNLLCVDQQNSTLKIVSKQEVNNRSYTPYGFCSQVGHFDAPLGFICEYIDSVTGCYLLGNGYRAYNPVLTRFNSPDSLSPFKEGGLNAYAYCKGDPVNYQDNNGHNPLLSSLVRVLNQGVKPIKTSSAGSLAADAVHNLGNAGNKALPVAPAGYQLIGYHGSKSKHIANLVSSGLDPEYIGHSVGTLYGPGFYTTPDIRVARMYNKASQRFNGIGRARPNSVAAVFVKDLPSKRPGANFSYFKARGIIPEQLVIRQNMYRDVMVIPLSSFSSAKRPVGFAELIRGPAS